MTGRRRTRAEACSSGAPSTARPARPPVDLDEASDRRCPTCRVVLWHVHREGVLWCAECQRRFRVALRIRGAALERGLLRSLRRTLGEMAGSCARCQGTGLARPAATERAMVLALARGRSVPLTTPCRACSGTGLKPPARRARRSRTP